MGEHVQDEAEERRHERTEHVEAILDDVREDLGNRKYPVTSEELGAAYADHPLDLPNETESLGSVFDRIDGEFEDEESAYDAVVDQFESSGYLDEASVGGRPSAGGGNRPAAGEPEFDEPPDGEEWENSIERSQDRAREAQADSYEEPDEGDGDQ